MAPTVVQRYLGQPLHRVVSAAFPPAFLQSQLSEELRGLRAEIAARMPGNPAGAGYKVYSQVDEDGILAAIFAAIGSGSKTFVEFGCGDGLENNTHALLLQDWRGVWVDGDAEKISFIESHFPRSTDRLSVEQAFVTAANVCGIVRAGLERLAGARSPIDLLSIDLDGNDAEFLRMLLGEHQPRVVCVEYNAKFAYPIDFEIAYDARHTWAGDDYVGASLGAFVRTLGDAYRLVACNLSGVNAFFVRHDLAAALPEYPVEDLFQPARYHLIEIASGHPPSLRHLANVLRPR